MFLQYPQFQIRVIEHSCSSLTYVFYWQIRMILFLYAIAILRTLGVTVDSGLTFDRRVGSIISACNYHKRALRHIRSALSDDLAVTVGRAIILSRIDYCN